MIGLTSQVKKTHGNDHQKNQNHTHTKKNSNSFQEFIIRAKPILRTALSVCTLGIFDLMNMAIKSYTTSSHKTIPRVTQQHALEKNLQILDSDTLPEKTPILYGIKEYVAANVRKKCSVIGGPDPFIYIKTALEEVRKNISSEQKVLTSNRYTELLETSLTRIYLNHHLQAEVQARLHKEGLPYPNNAIDLLLGIHSKEYGLLITEKNPHELKTKLENLSNAMYISAHNLHVQSGVIDECLLDGYKSILRALDFTPQETFLIPRIPIIAYLENIASKVEDSLNITGNSVLTVQNDYDIVQEKAAEFFGSIIQTGALAKARLDGDTALTAKLLAKALEVCTCISRNKSIEKISSPDPFEASNAAIQMYSLYSDNTRNLLGSEWPNLTQNQKNTFLCMVTMLIKHQNEKIGTADQQRLKDLEDSLSAEGLHATNLLAQQNINSPENSRIRTKITKISGGLKIVKALIGGRGFGLE